MKLVILITNPNHHLELTLGVAKLAQAAGDDVKYVSLCELRRMPSPVDTFRKEGLDFDKFSDLPQQLKPSSGKKSLGKSDSFIRKFVQRAFWLIKLKPFISKALTGADKVLILNDAAFPGDRICNWLRNHRIPFYLLQEGIRFPLPSESEVKYGEGGATRLLTWGERSANHFRNVATAKTEVVVSGSPRFDIFLRKIDQWEEKNSNAQRLGIFTNPIDDQGFCSKDEKLALFENFVKRASGYLNAKKVLVSVKSHPREDVDEYISVASRYIDNLEKSPKDILEAIMEVDAGVIMASTVGLELLGAKRPVAQMEIPGFGYVFDYTEDPGVLKIPSEGDFELDSLFEDAIDLKYFHEHVQKGESSERIYKHIKG